MMRFAIPALALIGIMACGSETNEPVATKLAPTEKMLAYADFKPIFDAKCVGCHGADDPKEDLRLDSYAAVMKGSEHGAMVIAGNASGSKLVKLIDGTEQPRMPLKKDPLSKEEIDKISAWVDQGAEE